eukprot:scaffold46155_cov60-Phaeocystis_antarctica.AAC.2
MPATHTLRRQGGVSPRCSRSAVSRVSSTAPWLKPSTASYTVPRDAACSRVKAQVEGLGLRVEG